MRLSSIVSLLVSGLSLASALPADLRITHEARAVIQPPRGSLRLRNVNYGGSGCPQGSLDWQLGDDPGLVPLIFDDFVAFTGGSPGDKRRFCQLNMMFSVPAGYSFSVWQTGFIGYAGLSSGSTGNLDVLYYFSGDTNQQSRSYSFRGPFYDDYAVFNTQPMGVYSPCGGEIMFNVRASVAVSGNSAMMSTDRLSGHFQQFLYLDWRRC